MSEFFKRYKRLILFVAAFFVVVLTIIFTTGDNHVSFFENLSGTALRPVTNFFSRGFGSLGGVFFSTKKENEVLKSENNDLKKDVAALSEALNENKRLKELVNYQAANSDYNYVTAKVTARSGNYFFSTFTIGAGKSSGVDAGMPVVSGSGLVGKVYESGATWSKVVSIVDTSSSVSAIVERTRDNGTVKGDISADGKSYNLYMEHLPVDAAVSPGDSVITSGLGGTYPKGIVIGTVGEVEQKNDGGIRVVINPASDFRRIEEVMVVTSDQKKNFLD